MVAFCMCSRCAFERLAPSVIRRCRSQGRLCLGCGDELSDEPWHLARKMFCDLVWGFPPLLSSPLIPSISISISTVSTDEVHATGCASRPALRRTRALRPEGRSRLDAREVDSVYGLSLSGLVSHHLPHFLQMRCMPLAVPPVQPFAVLACFGRRGVQGWTCAKLTLSTDSHLAVCFTIASFPPYPRPSPPFHLLPSISPPPFSADEVTPLAVPPVQPFAVLACFGRRGVQGWTCAKSTLSTDSHLAVCFISSFRLSHSLRLLLSVTSPPSPVQPIAPAGAVKAGRAQRGRSLRTSTQRFALSSLSMNLPGL